MKAPRKLTLVPLVSATYFMVSGGPYGLEDLVASAGYLGAIAVLVVTPVVWSLPTALMVGELSGAIPEEGGYFAWVKRAMGPFWGFQEAWLSLAASVFDMAIYPTLFALYLARLFPALGEGHAPVLVGLAMIAACGAWNLAGAKDVGLGSVVLSVVLLSPFALLAVFAVGGTPIASPAPTTPGLLGGTLVAMWNYMGWDNASTVASEVDRPQWTYPRAMLWTVALVALTYVVPVAAAWHAGIDASSWTTGSWVEAGNRVGGRWLGTFVALGGAVSAMGMFNALVLSYSRLPLALADDGYLPAWIGKRLRATDAPWVAIAVCCTAYAACLGLGFERLVLLDVVIYGLSLILEFVAFLTLRVRQPNLERPFRVPGGMKGAVLVSLLPCTLLVAAFVAALRQDGPAGLGLGFVVLAMGPVAYMVCTRLRGQAVVPR